MKLTEEQKLIIDECLTKNILINAGPGAGKSSILSIIADKFNKINPTSNILLLTFTNRASKSIIAKCDCIDKNKIIGGTFHSIAHKFIRFNHMKWNICDEGKKRLIIKKLFECKKDREKLIEIYDKVSFNKSQWPMIEDNETIKYNSELRKYNLIDFDDMIYEFIRLIPALEIPPLLLILTDELQDTSIVQLEMLKALQSKTKCKMIGACDGDQEIYTWRAARLENIVDFIKVFNCKILNMGYNFRCAVKIVEASSKLIEHNKNRLPKTLRPTKTEQGIVREIECQDIYKEIDYVVSKCRQYQDKEIAILYRNRTHKNYLEFELHKAGIRYRVNDVLDIADRSAVKVMISCMKLAAKIGDLYDLEIASKGLKGIGKTTINKLREEVKTLSFNEVIKDKISNKRSSKRFASLNELQVWYESNRKESLDHLTEFIETKFTSSFDYQSDMKTFIQDITKDYKVNHNDIRDLSNDLGLENKEEEQDKDAKVELSTLHGFKGDQRYIVLMPWCQMFLQQHEDPVNIEEERRLFYVGITRAEHGLFLTYTGDKPQFIKEMDI